MPEPKFAIFIRTILANFLYGSVRQNISILIQAAHGHLSEVVSKHYRARFAT